VFVACCVVCGLANSDGIVMPNLPFVSIIIKLLVKADELFYCVGLLGY